ncbi:hypothetical protein RN001_004124 [Aquatica leii]|uniref:Rab-GAP TBC domain-containing protein n=1 Tax=Aquatica leii TaxID=1421715 RepID=A0AAN7QPG6_9COLE|nr:hypothetical protein RN001_004124 [Aquatica leii]
MEEVKDKGIHYTSVKLCEDLKLSSSYINFFTDVQRVVSSSQVKVEEFGDSLFNALKETGLEAQLRNNVYYWIRNQVKENKTSAYDTFFKKAQIQWEKRIHKSLNSMCTELNVHLARPRYNSDREELIEKWGELSNYDVDVTKYRPVYSPKDFLEVLLNLKGPNYKPKADEPVWEFCHIPIKVKELHDLRILFSELSHGEPVLGIDVAKHLPCSYAAFEAERIELGEKVVDSNQAPTAQEYLKKGCPPSLRARIWKLVLGSGINETHHVQYEKLRAHVLQYDLMIDKLIIKDIHLTASNDDQYFVFEDILHQVLLCFSRDPDVLRLLPYKPGYMQVVLKGKTEPETTLTFPPSGVIPFHGFTMYAAPFCYLFEDSVELYFTIRAFYLRYWFRLHKICGHNQGVVCLCLLFERLLQCYDTALWHHFKKINIPPIRVVFKWIMRAFSGHLPPDQLLYLWDLILAYDSLEIIPLLAVIILIFRRANLLRVNTLQNIESVLADLSSISVMSMLQVALSKE